MYQWKEVRHFKTTGPRKAKRTIVYYTHHKEWMSHMVNSREFYKPAGHTNPNVPFPFSTSEQNAPEVNCGLFFLKSNTISQLGWGNS